MAAPRLTSLIRVPRWGLWFMRYSFSQSASSSITGTFPRRRPIPYSPETLPSSPLWGRPQPKGLHPSNSNTHPLYLQGQNQIAANLLDWNCSTSSAEKNPFHTPGRHLMSCQGPTLPGDWLATSFSPSLRCCAFTASSLPSCRPRGLMAPAATWARFWLLSCLAKGRKE